MKKFLVLFTCAGNSKTHEQWMLLDETARAERLKTGTLAMDQWVSIYGARIVDPGSSVGESGVNVDSNGVNETPSQIGKYMVVQARSIDEAAAVFVNHPHFAIFPGDGVKVLELVESRGPSSAVEPERP